MIKKYFLTFCSTFLAITFAFGQIEINSDKQELPFSKLNNTNDLAKTTSCLDTILFPQSRTTGVLADTMDYATYISGVSQIYRFSGSGVVHGVRSYVLLDNDGIPGNALPISLVYSITNTSGNDPGTIIHTDTATVIDVGFQEQTILFSSPVPVTQDFAITMQIDTFNYSNPSYVTNNYGDGAADSLASIEAAGVWYNIYEYYGAGWDADMLLAPIFEQDIDADYSVDTNAVCQGQAISFMDNSNTVMNSMFYTSPSTSMIDFGDGNSGNLDSNYVYASGGNYSTELTLTHYGYTANCVDTAGLSVMVIDSSTAAFGFSELIPGTFQFTNASSNANTYEWDFGDGNSSTDENPQHIYAASGDYMVCLVAFDSTGCGLDTLCQQVTSTVGLATANDDNTFNIYPIPAKKYFNVDLPKGIDEGVVELRDVLGQTVKRVIFYHNESIKVNTEELSSGVYFVTVNDHKTNLFKKRILIDK